MKKLICIAALLALSACAATPSTSGSKTQAQAAIQAAQAASKRAASVHFAWRDTGKMIKKAKALEADGQYGAATKLAEKAKRQGDNAYQQYLSQKNATGPRVN